MCLVEDDSTSCATGMDLFIIESQTGINEAIDGIWGMSSGLAGSSYLDGQYLPMNFFMDQGLITGRVFGFAYSTSLGATDNYLDFGTYSTMGMRDETELIWIDCEEDFWWVSYISGIKFGAGAGIDDNTYNIDTNYGRFFTDTGSSCSYVPSEYKTWLTTTIIEYSTDYSSEYLDSWGYIMSCDDLSLLPNV
jgi:hypothetical protein